MCTIILAQMIFNGWYYLKQWWWVMRIRVGEYVVLTSRCVGFYKQQQQQYTVQTLILLHILLINMNYLIASRIPPGRINWVVGGWVVFSGLAVFLFYQPNRSTKSTKSPTNYPTQPTKQTKQTNQPNQPTNQTMWETNAKIRNRPHFFSKWSPEGSKMRPRGTQNGSQNREKCDLGPTMLPRNYKNRFSSMSLTPWGGFLAPPGYPKIDQKWYFRGKWGSQGSHFFDFCWEGRCNPLFHRFFIDFWLKNRCIFHCFFPVILAFFWTWRPSR